MVKIGGRLLNSNLDAILSDIISLWRSGERVVLVHGGGDLVTEYSRRMGIEPKFVVSPSGIKSRYTSLEELEVYVMVMAGRVNKWIVARINGMGGRAIGITGADGPTLLAERRKRIVIVDERGRRRIVEGGYTGRIVSVNTELLGELLRLNYVVVVAPIAVDEEGTLLNVDGDQTALKLATALKAPRVVVLTDVEGLIVNGRVVEKLSIREAREILPMIGPGMNRKIIEAIEALESGVEEVIISSGLTSNPVRDAIAGRGTRITRL